MFKKLGWLICIVVFCLIVQISRNLPNGYLNITFCDVGQGDAILLTYSFWQMLIDTGPDDAVLACLEKKLPFWDKTIEVMLITHTDSDHVRGAASVLSNYRVNHLFLADVGGGDEYKNMLVALNSANSSNTTLKKAILGQKISFSPGGEVLILAPSWSDLLTKIDNTQQFAETLLSDVTQQKPSHQLEPNERSVVLYLRYQWFELLLMGDLPKENELALMEAGLITSVEGIKIGHHGSKTSTDPALIKKTQPEFAVVSCGLKNKFGHPAPETLETIQAHQVKIWRTDEVDTIELVTNGREYWFDQ
ncbi:MAG TPA: hypothetical protein PLM16_00930 [Candidatus Woesebacteria bacterium]|nr:hypothetical protein [Candidatus Woesebacteria bacterium]